MWKTFSILNIGLPYMDSVLMLLSLRVLQSEKYFIYELVFYILYFKLRPIITVVLYAFYFIIDMVLKIQLGIYYHSKIFHILDTPKLSNYHQDGNHMNLNQDYMLSRSLDLSASGRTNQLVVQKCCITHELSSFLLYLFHNFPYIIFNHQQSSLQ